MGSWDPAQYQRFRDERRRPFFDLLELLERHPNTGAVVDLGCGTGELTSVLHEALAPAQTIGVDSSAEMLAGSAKFARPGLTFERGDIEAWPGDERHCDVVFSNAALHWVEDHPALLARITAPLGPGGQLAVQVPANHDHPAHVVAAEVAATEPFATALQGYVRGTPVLDPRRYSELLHALGFARQHVRLQIYTHDLDSRDDVVEWVKGALLTAYKRRLDPQLYAEFLAAYRARLLPQLADERPYFLTYKRILMWGAKPR